MHVKAIIRHNVHRSSSIAHSHLQDVVAADPLGAECSPGSGGRASHTSYCQARKHETDQQGVHHTVHLSLHAHAFGETVQKHMHIHEDQQAQPGVQRHRNLYHH